MSWGTYFPVIDGQRKATKKVRRRNGKMIWTKFHTMETIDELHLRKCSTKTCTNEKKHSYMNCNSCLGYS